MSKNKQDSPDKLPFTLEEDQKPSTGVAVGTVGAGLPAVADDYGEDAGAGFENMDQSEIMIPMIQILQKGSPQVDDTQGEFIEGAKAGMFFNSITKEVYDGRQGIEFIPVHRTHQYVEWIPRTRGGGFVGTLSPDDPEVARARGGKAFGKFQIAPKDDQGNRRTDAKPEEMNDLMETFNVFGLLVKPDGSYEPGILTFASTQIRKYREWMHKARMIQIRVPGRPPINPPLFAHVYQIQTVVETKDQYTWYGYKINFRGGSAEAARLPQADELYQNSKSLRDMATAGAAKPQQPVAPVEDPELGGEQVF